MAKNLVDNSKEFLKYYYNTTTGEWVDTPNFKFNGRIVDSRVKKFIGRLFHFMLEGSMLSEYTKIWLTSNMNSIRQCFEAYNNQLEFSKKVDIHNVESTIYRDKRKLKEYFDADAIYNMLTYPENYMNEYEQKLDMLNRKFMADSEYKKSLAIKIPNDLITKTISDEDWDRLSHIIKTYSKLTIREIELNDSEKYRNMFGYFNYLISSDSLTEEQEDRLVEIKNMLGI